MTQSAAQLAPIGGVAKDSLSHQVGKVMRYEPAGEEPNHAVLTNGVDQWNAPIGELVTLSGWVRDA